MRAGGRGCAHCAKVWGPMAKSFFLKDRTHVAAPAALAGQIGALLRRGGPADGFFESPTASGLCAASEGGICGSKEVPTNRRIVRSVRAFDICGIGSGGSGDRELGALQGAAAALLGAGGDAGSGQQGVLSSLEGFAIAVLKEIVQACPTIEWRDLEHLMQYDQAEGTSILTIASSRAEAQGSLGGVQKRKREEGSLRRLALSTRAGG
mmetsp:Transcript_18389/g.45146  ORF Transcript_18389/g.45146 Transcript_18389/m.45146 type:complete len:208 (+) Transcript_18389:314-937(+)